MNNEIKAKWVSALRGGDYIKSKKQLYTVEGGGKETYCVLGVLAKLYCNAEKENISNLVLRDNCYLPEKVMNWAGLETSNPSVILELETDPVTTKTEYLNTSLIAINDKLDYSFDKLAKIIEKYL